jgi:phospholipase/carboxylesterase
MMRRGPAGAHSLDYLQKEDAEGVVLTPKTAPSGSVIWLHGLGADGRDFVPIVPELRLPQSALPRFVFPHAPVRAVTINNGARMRAWYDITGLSHGAAEDERGIRESAGLVEGLIRRERAAGIAASAIVLAGFSQGGAIALHTALRHAEALAGVIALSTYLPLPPARGGIQRLVESLSDAAPGLRSRDRRHLRLAAARATPARPCRSPAVDPRRS